MIDGINVDEVHKITLDSDKENPTIFKISLLPVSLFNSIYSGDINSMETVYNFLKASLKGWENFNVPYETEQIDLFGRKITAVKMSSIDCIPLKFLTELYKKILELNGITGEERKN